MVKFFSIMLLVLAITVYGASYAHFLWRQRQLGAALSVWIIALGSAGVTAFSLWRLFN